MRGTDIWDLFVNNLEALFEVHPRQLNVPTSLSGMQNVGSVDSGDGDYTTNEILALARTHRDQPDTTTHRTFYILFLDGFYRDETGRRADILGVSLGDTGVIAMFKPVIAGMSNAKQVEQTVLVHELGHAVGLVDNGVPLSVDHSDHAHGAHCDNPDCVMYWLNEGVRVQDMIRRIRLEGSPILFDDSCLSDIHFASAED